MGGTCTIYWAQTLVELIHWPGLVYTYTITTATERENPTRVY